jgi:hypothetical protein
MQRTTVSFRNKLMLACALVATAVLATPAAMAHDYRGHGDDTGKVLGALVVGAVIGGVIASASDHNDRYYDSGYYPAQSYPPQGYYSYPSYGSVNVGVVYSNRGGYHGGSRGYYGHGDSHGYRGGRNYGGHGGQGHYYSRHGH